MKKPPINIYLSFLFFNVYNTPVMMAPPSPHTILNVPYKRLLLLISCPAVAHTNTVSIQSPKRAQIKNTQNSLSKHIPCANTLLCGTPKPSVSLLVWLSISGNALYILLLICSKTFSPIVSFVFSSELATFS